MFVFEIQCDGLSVILYTSAGLVSVRICPLNGYWSFEYKSCMTSHRNEIMLLLENNKMLPCKIKMQKKR